MVKAKSTAKTGKKRAAVKVTAVPSDRKVSVKEEKSSLSAPHFNMHGEKERVVVLPSDIFESRVDPRQIAQVLRVYQTNLRQGTVATKTRGEVAGSTRKIYRQKGTGRARHGSMKAPIFVGGGIVFGPHPREFDANIPKKMRRQVIRGLLSQKRTQGQVSVVTGLTQASGKTKEMASLIQKMGFAGKKLLLVVDPSQAKVQRAARNIERMTVRPANSLSALDIAHCEKIIFAKEALEAYKKLQTGVEK